MRWMERGVKWILLVSGLLTLTMLEVAFRPAALAKMFGQALDGAAAEIVVRSWGFLIALVGAMLVYAAFRPAVRPLVLVVASLSKLFFVLLVLTTGRQFLAHQAGVAVVADSVMALLFLACLFAGSRGNAAHRA